MSKNGGSKAGSDVDGGTFCRQLPLSEQMVVDGALAPSSLIVIEPNPLLREGLARLIEDTRYDVLASSSSFTGLVVRSRQAPDIALIGGDDAFIIRALEECHAAYPSARRVVLNDGQGDRLGAIFEAGAHACLARDVTLRALLMTLDLALLGANIVCCPTAQVPSRSIVPAQSMDPTEVTQAKPGVAEVAHRLSSREVAILECLMHGDSNKLIAKKFQIAEATVKVHIKAILRKIRAANRTQAAIWAMSNLAIRGSRRDESAVGTG